MEDEMAWFKTSVCLHSLGAFPAPWNDLNCGSSRAAVSCESNSLALLEQDWVIDICSPVKPPLLLETSTDGQESKHQTLQPRHPVSTPGTKEMTLNMAPDPSKMRWCQR